MLAFSIYILSKIEFFLKVLASALYSSKKIFSRTFSGACFFITYFQKDLKLLTSLFSNYVHAKHSRLQKKGATFLDLDFEKRKQVFKACWLSTFFPFSNKIKTNFLYVYFFLCCDLLRQ